MPLASTSTFTSLRNPELQEASIHQNDHSITGRIIPGGLSGLEMRNRQFDPLWISAQAIRVRQHPCVIQERIAGAGAPSMHNQAIAVKS